MEYVEFSAKTVDDAITKACEYFQVPSTKLDYEVKDQGSTGFLFLGGRDAKISARAKTDDEILKEEKALEEEKKNRELQEKREKAAMEAAKAAMEESPDVIVTPSVSSKASSVKPDESDLASLENNDDNKNHSPESVHSGGRRERRNRHESGGKSRHSKSSHNAKRSNANFVTIDDKNNVMAFFNEMFAAMKMEVNVELKYAEEERILDVDFSGPSMGILIGKRGQTLDAIQYLTSLVVNKGDEEYIHVKVDTENYRKRRKDTLENLAKNISFKVKRSRRPVSLEPMNPYERRIIHSTLQNDRYVTTYSEGNEPYRRVVVAPTSNGNREYK